jgi:MOSC domain-containing protein YiiM
MTIGRVEAIVTGPRIGEPLQPVPSVRVKAGHGIEGDRKWSADVNADAGRDLTLIEAEALEALARDTGIVLEQHEARRQVVTRGIPLNGLVGRRFRVGELDCIGIELCEPCSHLASLTQPGVLRGLVHRGGLNAAVLTDGEISVGDEVAPL